MVMADSIISQRAFAFASHILRLCSVLEGRGSTGRHLAWQLIRCGTSIGANAEEAQEAQTKPAYISSMSISRKECREAQYWLRLALASEATTQAEVNWALDEVTQLLAMIRRAVRTAQSSSSRGVSP